VDTYTGEFQERRLQHREEAEKLYRDLAAQGMQVRVGMEASGQARWFERLLSELHVELWIGDNSLMRFLLVEAAQVTVRTENRQGRHGPQTSGSSVLDVAQGMGLRADEKVRFERGTTRKSRWCAIDDRAIDWGSRSPFAGSSK
jgi:hypothetical protein